MFSKAGHYLMCLVIGLAVTVAVIWELLRDIIEFLVFQVGPPFLLLLVLAAAMDFSDRLT